jgi:SAM-dependent methyltransferase
MLNSIERFSSRVENYVKYRPSYPPEVMELLQNECGLAPSSIVADIGSGTGILTKLLLATGATVFAIEPNRQMRSAAEGLLNGHTNFRSVNGTAEATTLPNASIDLIVAGQAFHWFDPQAARQEFSRISKPLQRVALLWNERPLEATAFLDAYEALLRKYAPEYDQVNSLRADEQRIQQFFGGAVKLAIFPNEQQFDFAGLRGRLLSSSYAPEIDHPLYEPLIAELQLLFDQFQQHGQVMFPYRTLVYFGQLS